MLKFGTPTIALPLAIKKCTVQTGCTVLTNNLQETAVFSGRQKLTSAMKSRPEKGW